MKPAEKNLRGQWSESDLRKALKAISDGRMSQRKAAQIYGIPRRTLRNHIKSGSKKKVTGRLPTLSQSQERELVQRIVRLAQVGMPLTPKLVRKQAYEFCAINDIPNIFNDKAKSAGRKWLSAFIKRHPQISLRKAQIMNPGRAQKLNKPIVKKHFEAIKQLYDELDIVNHPERLYNMDEKGCRLNLHHQQRVLAEKGSKRVHLVSHEHAENVTIAMCINAAGNTVPPMILFKGKRMKPEYSDHLPPGSLVKMAPKGCMTIELFVQFIHHLGVHKSPGKCLLIFDGASSHLGSSIVDAADEHNIVLYCLPSNTTHELQPLDKSVNKSYEHFWDEQVLLYTYQHPDRKITKQRFTKIFSEVWSKCMSNHNIINGFRATGLYPFDPHAIPEEAYAPSILTQTSNLRPQMDVEVNDPVSIPSRRQSISSDKTNCNEAMRESSPSILIENVNQSDEENLDHIYPICPSPLLPTNKLVDYSSSSDISLDNNHPSFKTPVDRALQFQSPIASTSGLNNQYFNRVYQDYTSSSESENETLQMLTTASHNRRTYHNIYTSTSESDEENIEPRNNDRQIAVCTNTVPDKVQDSSDDDEPLSKYKEAVKTSFHKQIPTPNYATGKGNNRRKALNYIGQKITKDLFDIVKEKKKTKNAQTKKDTQTKKQKKYGKKKIVKHSKNINITCAKEDIDVWYCKACKTERMVDMRQCRKCKEWYHEECVGLTKDDKDIFECPNCD